MRKNHNVIKQTGGSLNIETDPNNPFKVQQKPIKSYSPPVNNSNSPQSYPYPRSSPQSISPADRYKSKSPVLQKDPTATINLYPPSPPQKPTGIKLASSPYLPFSLSDLNPSGFPKLYNPYGPELNSQYYNPGGEHAIPIGFIKNYNIFADNIKDYQTKYLPIIYEDSIPMRGAKHELTTLSERILLYEYIKNNLVSYEEGEEGCLNHNGGINLLRQLKYLSPHPVNYNILYTNPLQGLRKGIRIYRSCYPITTDRANKTLCQKGGLSLHIRFYNKSYFDIELLPKQSPDINKMSDMKRELEFYRWIRANILLKKVCPNFIMIYTYNNCLSCNEPFNELDKSKIVRPMPSPFTQNMKPKEFLKSTILPKLDKQCLVVITEGANMNILEWMTNTREYAFNKKTQKNIGYYPANVWYSIYFQIFAALYTLHKNNIYIKNFGYDNIWIKQIPKVGYWKYIINNIPYYVHNHGWLVLIDCSFKSNIADIKLPSIISNSLFGEDDSNIKNVPSIKEMWKQIINDDPFGRGLVNASVRLPPKEILNIIKKASDFLQNDNNIDDIFLECMNIYLHNRISTSFNHYEQKTVDNNSEYIDLINYNKGELVCYINDLQQKQQFALYLGNNKLFFNGNIIPNISGSEIKKLSVSGDEIHQKNVGMIDLSRPPLATYNLD